MSEYTQRVSFAVTAVSDIYEQDQEEPKSKSK